MKKIIYILALLPILLTTGGCNNYLGIVPEDDIETVESIFEKRDQAEDWYKTCYYLFQFDLAFYPNMMDRMATDEYALSPYLVTNEYGSTYYSGLHIAEGRQNSISPYASIWSGSKAYASIRYSNEFIANIDRAYNMTAGEKQLWKSEIMVLKANVYFELMRRYGPIVLVPHNIGIGEDISAMLLPRSPITECVAEMVRLIDEALPNLESLSTMAADRQGYYSKEAAMALKAKILLYAASPLFNGNEQMKGFVNEETGVEYFPEYDKERWKLAIDATEAAISACEGIGKTLFNDYTIDSEKSTSLLNTIYDIQFSAIAPYSENREALQLMNIQSGFFISTFFLPYVSGYDSSLGRDDDGTVAASMKMVEEYYTVNGLPIDEDKEWDYHSRYALSKETSDLYYKVVPTGESVLSLHLRREPRFYAHIAADRTYWQLGSQESKNLLVQSRKDERMGTKQSSIVSNVPQNVTGYYIKKLINPDIDVRNSYSSYNRGSNPYVVMRLAELYLMLAEAWNEYLDVPDSRVYEPLDVVRERAGIPDIVSAWTTYARTPSKITSQGGMRDIIMQEWNVEFAFEGHRFWNVRRWKTAAVEFNTKAYGWNIAGSTAEAFYNNFEGPKAVTDGIVFDDKRDYFFPIRGEEVITAGIEQNPGW